MNGSNIPQKADWNAESGPSEIVNKPTLGTMAAQDSADVNITGGQITGIGQINTLGLDVSGGVITNVGNPITGGDAVNKAYLDSVIPAFGTMATQNADNVDIQGGTITNTSHSGGNILADELSAQVIGGSLGAVGMAEILYLNMQDGVIDAVWKISASSYEVPGEGTALIENFRVKGLPSPVDAGDAVPKGYVDGKFVAKESTDATPINAMRALTQAQYDALTPDANTVYIITSPAGRVYLGATLIVL